MYYNPIDLLEKMNWPEKEVSQGQIKQMALMLDPVPQAIVSLIEEKGPIHRDAISIALNMPHAFLASHLLALELDGYIHLQAGNSYIRL